MVSSSEQHGSSSMDGPSTGQASSEVRPISRVSSRGASSDDQVSGSSGPTGFKRARCDEEDDQQPGPSSKIAMVTSSAHVVVEPCSQQPQQISGAVVSSSEQLHVGSSSSAVELSSDSTTGAVTSSEVGSNLGATVTVFFFNQIKHNLSPNL